jgi:hypothetical protein
VSEDCVKYVGGARENGGTGEGYAGRPTLGSEIGEARVSLEGKLASIGFTIKSALSSLPGLKHNAQTLSVS